MSRHAHPQRSSVRPFTTEVNGTPPVSHLLRALETFNALGSALVSHSDQRDPTTPTGKMVSTGLGAVAELERSLIVERVKAGLRNARAKGKRLGRPNKVLSAS